MPGPASAECQRPTVTPPGLDDLTARKLLEFRDQKGGFNSIDQIREVIGSDRFDKLKGYLIVR